MDSGEESSPWDSPLTSARDPVKRKEHNAKNAGLVPELRTDNKEKKLERPRSPLENSDSTVKGNGSWVEFELPCNKPSPQSEEVAHQTTPKSPSRVTSEYKIPPFEDFRQALKSTPKQVDSDEDHLEKPFPLPVKNTKGAVYKAKSPKNSSVEDLSLWSSNTTGNAQRSSQPRKNDTTEASLKGKGQTPEQMPVHVKQRSRKNRGSYSEMPAGQTQIFGPSSIGSGDGGEGSSLKQTKEKSVLIKEEPELKLVGYSAHDHGKNLKELGHENYATNLEPVYTEAETLFEKPTEVRIVTDLVCYKDDRHMYQFDYGHKHYYQARMEVDEAYMMKLADRSKYSSVYSLYTKCKRRSAPVNVTVHKNEHKTLYNPSPSKILQQKIWERLLHIHIHHNRKMSRNEMSTFRPKLREVDSTMLEGSFWSTWDLC